MRPDLKAMSTDELLQLLAKLTFYAQRLGWELDLAKAKGMDVQRELERLLNQANSEVSDVRAELIQRGIS